MIKRKVTSKGKGYHETRKDRLDISSVIASIGVRDAIERERRRKWAESYKYIKGYNDIHVDVDEVDIYGNKTGRPKKTVKVKPLEKSTVTVYCPNGGTHDVIKNGVRVSQKGVYQRYRCKTCGKQFEFICIVDPAGKSVLKRPIEPVKPRIKTLEELKAIKLLKDQIANLEARITRKDVQIKSLKRKVEKLKKIIDAPENEKQAKLNDLIENPDFLEIV
jgi:hypothetical protein